MSRGFGWIYLGTGALAVLTARPYAGGWNDGSRLATVECLVDHRTWAIDESIYLAPATAARPPYAPDTPAATYGTFDKLLIDGRFYSDKSPVPAIPMAGVYQAWRWAGGPPAADRPDLFALGLTWLFAGLPYLLAVVCVARVTRHVGVPPPWDLVIAATFAFGSLALPYAQHVNNHVLLLAVAAAVGEAAVRPGPFTVTRAAWLGLLAGFAYTIDLGAGPPLVVAVACLVVWRAREPAGGPGWVRMLAFAVAAIPFPAIHHALTYAIAGTIGPANANPEYLDWPGSPFTGPNRTGQWQHPSLASAGLYALDLLFGKKGFLLYSPPLILAVLVVPWVLSGPYRERAAVVALTAWAVATWLLYAATSRNLSGLCLSVRWFVPLLAPGYLVLAVLARDVPTWRKDIAVLAAGGVILTGELVWRGPWDGHVPKLLWPVVATTILVWSVLVARRLRRRRLT
jgi:hypothetical protein